ncbi:Crp/Fnr family transcriptional regulator [bacterium]|nr:Crp/Fnr family transcriptional regulator [bacterium]
MDTTKRYLEVLKKVILFNNLSEEEIHSLLGIVTHKSFPKNYFIVKHNEGGDTMFIILKGEVKVSIFNDTGREVILDMLRKGDFFGEMALIDDMPRSASVITTTNVETLMVKREEFQSHLVKFPTIALNILKVMVKRLRKADDIINSLSVYDVAGRISRFITKVYVDSGVPLIDNAEVLFDFTHKDIASHIGSTRESVTRALSKMVETGLINITNKKLSVSDSERLMTLFQK